MKTWLDMRYSLINPLFFIDKYLLSKEYLIMSKRPKKTFIIIKESKSKKSISSDDKNTTCYNYSVNI